MLGRNIGIAALLVILFGHACCAYLVVGSFQPGGNPGMGIIVEFFVLMAFSALAFALLVIGSMVASSGESWPYPDKRFFLHAWALWGYPLVAMVVWGALLMLVDSMKVFTEGGTFAKLILEGLAIVTGLLYLGLLAGMGMHLFGPKRTATKSVRGAW